MTIAEMLTALRQPVEPAALRVKQSQGEKRSYLPWYNAVAVADARLGGAWSHEIVEHWVDDAMRGSKDRGYSETSLAHVRVRVTVHGSDGTVSREAIGVDDEPTGQRGTPLERAEGAGLRRALAKLGLGLHLYGGGTVQDLMQAIEGCQTEAELDKLGETIKTKLSPAQAAQLRKPYMEARGAIRRAMATLPN